MSVITSRLPADRRLPRAIARLGFLNGLLGAALIGAGVGAYFAVAGTGTTTVPPRTATVQRGVVLSTTSATGTLQAATELNVGFMAAGTITSVAVKPGERVKRGQVLGHIDDTSAQQSLDQAQASLATAQAQYEATLTGETAVQRRQDALSIAQAKQTLANAEATKKQDAAQSAASVTQAQNALRTDQGQEKVDLYQQTQDRATYANADAANAAIAADKTQLTNDQAKQQADTQQQLNLQHQQTVDKQNLSLAQSDLAQAQAAKDTAAAASDQDQVDDFNSDVNNDQNQLDALSRTLQLDGYAITQDNTKLSNDQAALTALQNDTKAIRADEAKIVADRQGLDTAKMNATATAARDVQTIAGDRMAVKNAKVAVAVKQAPPTAAALAAARASIVNAQVGVATAQKTLDETVLRAPIAATVASVGGQVGTAESGGGNSALSSSSSSTSGTGSSGGGSSTGFVTLTGINGMELVAGFAETDTAKLRVGQPATVTVDALPNTELAAHIVAIDGTATSSSGVVTYNVTFALDRSEPGLKSGMTANVDVIVGEADNVLHVPTAAVNGSGSNASVTVLRNGKQVRVPVVAGLAGDSSTAILSGLTTGQTVVLPQVTISSTGGSSNTTGGGTLNFGGGGGGGARARFFGG
ncbi:MAG TPA: biotin/lipoyl-binding protein [Gaiellaceae bacterium]|nr:biotin/lipoyl-binding protein [Gaiellaceae bacterium]